MAVGDRVPRIFKQLAGVGIERPMIALENQHVVTPPFFDNLPGDVALTIKRVCGYDPAF